MRSSHKNVGSTTLAVTILATGLACDKPTERSSRATPPVASAEPAVGRTQGDSLRAGLLIVPFEDAADTLRGESGDLIRFRDSGGARVDIELHGRRYHDVWSVELIPLDSAFAPYYLYRVLRPAGRTIARRRRR